MSLIIPESADNFAIGEDYFYKYFTENFPDGWLCYFNLEIDSYETDFILLSPEGYIYVIEVKAYSENSKIEVLDYNFLKIDGFKLKSPLKQVKNYVYALRELLIRNSINIYTIPVVCYPRLNEKDSLKKGLDILSKDFETIYKDDFENNTITSKLNNMLNSKKYSDFKQHNLKVTKINEFRELFESNHTLKKSMWSNESNNDYGTVNQLRKEKFSLVTLYEEDRKEFLLNNWSEGIKIYLIMKDQTELSSLLDYFIEKSNLPNFILDQLYKREGSTQVFNIEPIYTNNQLDFIDFYDDDFSKRKEELDYLKKSTTFNYEQYNLTHHNTNEHINVSAGAGTGKTHSMISRISYLIFTERPNINLLENFITMITFTNKASNEMKERIKSYFKKMYLLTSNIKYKKISQEFNNVRILTIDKFIKELLVDISYYIGYGTEITINNYIFEYKEKIEELVDLYCKENDLNISQLEIEPYKIRDIIIEFTEKINQKNYSVNEPMLDFGEAKNNGLILDMIIEVAKKSERYINEYAKKRNSITLSNLTIELISKLKKANIRYNEIFNNYIDYMFIDEFQDTDDIQIELLSTLQKLFKFKYFIVGDVKQCIYRFRGAEDQAFTKIRLKNPEIKFAEYHLKYNYRSNNILIDQFNIICNSLSNKGLLKFDNEKDQLLPYRKNASPGIQKNTIDDKNRIDRLKEILEKTSYNSIGVLTRTNYEIRLLSEGLAGSGINIITEEKRSFFNSKPIVDLYCLINGVIHNSESLYLFQLFNTSYTQGNFFDHKSINTNDIMSKFKNNQIIDQWTDYLEAFKNYPALKVIRDLINNLEPWKNFRISHDLSEQEEDYYRNSLFLIIEELAGNSSSDYLTLSAIEDYLRIKIYTKSEELDHLVGNNIRKNNNKKIYLQTIHKSKGLEYDLVILPFSNKSLEFDFKNDGIEIILDNNKYVGMNLRLNDFKIENTHYSNLKKNDKRYQLEEEVRVFYVAMTRAIEELYLLDNGKNSTNKTWVNIVGDIQ